MPTPGNNVNRYRCGAMDAATGLLTWVRAERNNVSRYLATRNARTRAALRSAA